MHALAFRLCQVATLVVLLGAFTAKGAFSQERFAILVGVSGYPYLSPEDRLNIGSELDPTKDGPANDVTAIKTVLTQRGFKDENVLVLADGIDNTPLPTRENILSAFEATSQKLVAGNGDYVFVFFAGHGSQQPSWRSEPGVAEPDRLDEVFLPYDVRPWDEDQQRLPNALLDDEVGALLAILRNKGAFVWMVADTCHSATLTRSGTGALGEEVRFRALDFMTNRAAQNARDPSASPKKMPTLVEPVALTEGAGGFVGFFAAQAHQSAPQARLPKRSDTQKTQGWFTYAMTTILSEEPNITYGQLSRRILDVYNSEYISRFVTPYYEGIDMFQGATVFGETSSATHLQWQVRKDFDGNLLLPAGALHGIGAGTNLALYPTASAGEEELLGFVEVVEVKMTEAVVTQSVPQGAASTEPKRLPARAWARLVDHKPALELGVSLSVSEGVAESIATDVRETLQEAAQRQNGWSFRSEDQPGDVMLEIQADRMTVSLAPNEKPLNGGGKGMETAFVVSLDLPAAGKAELRSTLLSVLDRVYKTALLRQAAGMVANDGDLKSVGLAMELCADKGQTCRAFAQKQNDDVPALRPGDVLRLSVNNTEVDLIDYTVLHVGPDLQLSAVSQGRLTASDFPQMIMEGRITPDTTGAEQVIVILVEGRAGEEASSFAHFATPADVLVAELAKDANRGGPAPRIEVAERARIHIFDWKTDLP